MSVRHCRKVSRALGHGAAASMGLLAYKNLFVVLIDMQRGFLKSASSASVGKLIANQKALLLWAQENNLPVLGVRYLGCGNLMEEFETFPKSNPRWRDFEKTTISLFQQRKEGGAYDSYEFVMPKALRMAPFAGRSGMVVRE